VKRPGVYEREAGIPLRELFNEVAGGALRGQIKAVLAGFSSAAITPDRFAVRADFGSLAMIGTGLGSAGFIVLDETRSMPRVAQAVARFLFVESCNQCSACKQGLRIASEAIDELFDPAKATLDDIERAVVGARSAPQGNRCYLPVQGSILIANLVDRFHDELVQQANAPQAATEPFLAPVIIDFDEAKRSFSYDVTLPYKNPDWTYSFPTERPAEPPPPEFTRRAAFPARAPVGPVSVRLDPDVLAAAVAQAEKQGVALDRLINALMRAALR
jgi:NADH-quinone oxidoreductase subunit F